MSTTSVVACSRVALRWAARRAEAGEEIRVMQCGDLVGPPWERLGSPADLPRWRDAWGSLCWVPTPGAGLCGMDPGTDRFVAPACHWDLVFERHRNRVLAAGGDVVRLVVEQIVVEDGQVVGVETDCGYEWVDSLYSDADSDVLACLLRGGPMPVHLTCTEVRCRLDKPGQPAGLPAGVRVDPLTPDEVVVTLEGAERARDRAMRLLAEAGVVARALSSRQGPRVGAGGVQLVGAAELSGY